ncbi:response regulator [Anaerotignum faecicola]
MDVMMPVMDGLTAAKEIHATNRVDAAEIPIFAMTANAFYDDVRQSREAGMVEHLSKPIQEQELLDAIRRHVKR